MARRLTWIAFYLSIPAALYCLGGVIQAASLFTGERAQRNYNFWGGLFLACCVLFLVSAVFLWRGRHRTSEHGAASDRAA